MLSKNTWGVKKSETKKNQRLKKALISNKDKKSTKLLLQSHAKIYMVFSQSPCYPWLTFLHHHYIKGGKEVDEKTGMPKLPGSAGIDKFLQICDHLQATELQITSLLQAGKGKRVIHL